MTEKIIKTKKLPEFDKKAIRFFEGVEDGQRIPNSPAAWLEAFLHAHWEEQHDGRTNYFSSGDRNLGSARSRSVFLAAETARCAMSDLASVSKILDSPLWTVTDRMISAKMSLTIGIKVLERCRTCGPLLKKLNK